MKQYSKPWIYAATFLLCCGFFLSFLTASSILEKHYQTFEPKSIAESFDYPVGPPNADGYYNAQGFGKNNHLGDDWNANSGGNTDLGDPVYAVGNGVVTFAKDVKGGWGNVIRIKHKLTNGDEIESLYAHCDTVLVKVGQQISKGNQIGTIGTAHGIYYAHLHLEIRNNVNLPLGGGYSSVTRGYLNPTEFIKSYR